MYQHYGIAGLFTDSNGCVTPFVRWIEDYPLLDGLKMPPYVGSYDVKGDPDNYLHLFEEEQPWKKIRIVVSTIHAVVKFYTPCGIGTIFSTYEPNKVEEGQKKVKESIPEVTKDVLSYVDEEERIVVHGKHPEQIVVIGKHLPTSFKRKLQDLFLSNADVFAWTCADMTRIPRTIMVGGKSFNTDHKGTTRGGVELPIIREAHTNPRSRCKKVTK
nr:reverse transcriptase domain-containing protein [Tanacetum cinerariifolium]